MFWEAESVINSRPVCYVYSDEVGEVLTPSHLINGRRIKTEPQNDVIISETNGTLSKRLLHLERLIEHFYKRWKFEYLTELREYQSCNNAAPTKSIQVGDVVLIEDKKLPRSRWRLGLVTNLLQSKDGYVRGCRLRVSDGKNTIFLQRPINQLCYFEVKSEGYKASTITDENEKTVEEENDKSRTVTEIPKDIIKYNVTPARPRRKAAILGELKRISSHQE